MTYTIYGLFDVRELDHVRYIGFTQDTESRFRQHLYDASVSTGKNYRLNWIRKVLREGSTIILKSIEIVTVDVDAAQLEMCYIKEYLRAGHKLTNGTKGGEGVNGYGGVLLPEAMARRVTTQNTPENLAKRSVQSSEYWADEEAREQQRVAMEAWWSSPESESLRKITSERSKEQMKDPEYRAKLHSETARQKMSDFMRGRKHPHTPEWNAKIAAAQRGQKRKPWTPEQRANHMRGMNHEKMSASAKARRPREKDEDPNLFD